MITSRLATSGGRLAAVVAAAATLSLVATGSAQAASGDLDPSWSGDGLQTQLSGANTALASASQTDGKILVAGTGTVDDGTASFGGTYVARYTASGDLDSSYGAGGVRKFSVAPGAEFVRSMVVDSSGRALVGGFVAATDGSDETDVFVVRLTASGAIDTTFGGGDGIVLIDRSNHDRGGALAISGKRILVAGGIDTEGSWGLLWTVFALNSAGDPDNTFSGDGQASVPVAKVGSYDSLRDIAVQTDGKIVLGGSTGTDFATARMTANGELDPSYDGDGVARVRVKDGGAGYRLLVQPDKRIVLAGYASGTGRPDTDMAVVRWTATGALDGSFGSNGQVLVDGGSQRNDRAFSAALAADSKIVLVGSSESATGGDSSVVRLNWDGTPDTSISEDGLMITSTLDTSNEEYDTVVVTAGDAIRAFGYNHDGWTLVGYNGGADYNLSVAKTSVVEGASGTTKATFKVTLSAPSPQPITVKFKTANGTAIAPDDYASRSGTLTIPAGVTSATITVQVVGDVLVEADETFKVKLSKPTNAGISRAAAVGTIVNDD
jgi:uncharacterized delta-60 repeat protein